MYKRSLQFVLLLVVSLGLLACSPSNSPEKAINEFYSAVETKDFDKAISYVYLGDVEKAGAMSTDKLKMMLYFAAEAMEKQGGVKEIKIGEITYNEDKSLADVVITVNMKNGESETDSRTLILKNGQWLIMMSK